MKTLDIDDLAKRYAAGDTFASLGRLVGVKGDTIRCRFLKAGIPVRPGVESIRLAKTIVIAGIESLAARYQAGESINQLAEEVGVSRTVLTNRFVKMGVPLRNQSEAEKTKWSRIADPERRRRQVAAAHEAVRGSVVSLERKRRCVITRFQKCLHASPDEKAVVAALRDARSSVYPQFPYGPYNLDIALESDRIAVELYRGGWPGGNYATESFDRTKYLLDRDWCVMFVLGPIHDPGYVAGKIIAFAEAVRRDKALRGKYWVVGSDPTRNPKGSRKLHSLPRIMSIEPAQESPLNTVAG